MCVHLHVYVPVCEQRMTSDHPEPRRLMLALANKVATSKHELTSQEIGNAIFGMQVFGG